MARFSTRQAQPLDLENAPELSSLLFSQPPVMNEPMAANDPNSASLYQQIYSKAQPFLDPNHSEVKASLDDFKQILTQSISCLNSRDNTPSSLDFFEECQAFLLKTPNELRKAFEHHPTQEYLQTVRKRQDAGHVSNQSINSTTERRTTMQPKLSISTKPVHRPLSYVETASLRENLILENFQVLCYYLSNVLYSIHPLIEQASRFSVVRGGRFKHVDDPEKALRYDKHVRNLNIYTFNELRTIILKTISKQFRTLAETQFDSALDRYKVSDYLVQQEVSVKQAEYLENVQGDSISFVKPLIEPVIDDSVVRTTSISDRVSLDSLLSTHDNSWRGESGVGKMQLLQRLRDRKAALEKEIAQLFSEDTS